MAKFLSIFNNKGGVGKTTITWNVADALAVNGKRVLTIDFDPQCNLSIAILGEKKFSEVLPQENHPYGTTIRSYLQRFLQNTGDFDFFSHKGVNTHENVSVVAGDFWLNVYAESLSVGGDLLTGTGITKYAVLRDLVDFAERKENVKYDYVLIDLPPSFGSIVRAALYCSDYFIVPATSDTYSSYCIGLIAQMLPEFIQDWNDGYARFAKSNPHINKYKQLGRPKFGGMIFNGFDMRSGSHVKADKIHLDHLKKAIKSKFIDNDAVICGDVGGDGVIGEVEDMNVLIQNSIWQSIPIRNLRGVGPLKTLQEKGNWASNQIRQIGEIGNAFDEIAKKIIANLK